MPIIDLKKKTMIVYLTTCSPKLVWHLVQLDPRLQNLENFKVSKIQ